jgi:hypothetical protein
MTLPLTPQRLAATYECLRVFPPFNRLKLPDDVKLIVSQHRDRFGQYTSDLRGEKHYISISAKKHGHFDSVVQTLAHEMIHLHQGVAKTYTRAQHNSEFHRIAKRACRLFGWDAKTFIGTD